MPFASANISGVKCGAANDVERQRQRMCCDFANTVVRRIGEPDAMLFARLRINGVEARADARADAHTRQRSEHALGHGRVLNQQAIRIAFSGRTYDVVFRLCLRGDETHASISEQFFFKRVGCCVEISE